MIFNISWMMKIYFITMCVHHWNLFRYTAKTQNEFSNWQVINLVYLSFTVFVSILLLTGLVSNMDSHHNGNWSSIHGMVEMSCYQFGVRACWQRLKSLNDFFENELRETLCSVAFVNSKYYSNIWAYFYSNERSIVIEYSYLII